MMWIEANKKFGETREINYGEVLNKFVFDHESQTLQRRKICYSIGKLQHVSRK